MTGTDPYRWVHGSGGVALIQYSCAQALSLPLNAKKHAQKNLQIIDRRGQKQNLHFWFSVGRAEILSANTRSFGGKTAGKKNQQNAFRCRPAWIKLARMWCVCICVSTSPNRQTLRHYGNAGITMKRAARGTLRANFYVQRLISRPTVVAPIYPVRVTHEPAAASSNLPSCLFPRHTVSPLLISRFLRLPNALPTSPAATPVFHLHTCSSIHSSLARHDYLLRFCLSVPGHFLCHLPCRCRFQPRVNYSFCSPGAVCINTHMHTKENTRMPFHTLIFLSR